MSGGFSRSSKPKITRPNYSLPAGLAVAALLALDAAEELWDFPESDAPDDDEEEDSVEPELLVLGESARGDGELPLLLLE